MGGRQTCYSFDHNYESEEGAAIVEVAPCIASAASPSCLSPSPPQHFLHSPTLSLDVLVTLSRICCSLACCRFAPQSMSPTRKTSSCSCTTAACLGHAVCGYPVRRRCCRGWSQISESAVRLCLMLDRHGLTLAADARFTVAGVVGAPLVGIVILPIYIRIRQGRVGADSAEPVGWIWSNFPSDWA
ncbi:hypothetical protein C8R45DRAFT_636117 [Mycena sanguinolenta]|nr:hypothetical protein C8R45DRAFT_636117 [Mycena sanguinolenta]